MQYFIEHVEDRKRFKYDLRIDLMGYIAAHLPH